MDVNDAFHRCRWCKRSFSGRSGLVKHEKHAHLRELLNPSSSSDMSPFDLNSDSDTSLSSIVSDNSSRVGNHAVSSIDSEHSDGVEGENCDDFYFDAQIKTMAGTRRVDDPSTSETTLIAFCELMSQLELTKDKIDLLLGFLHRKDVVLENLPRCWLTYERKVGNIVREGAFESDTAYADGEVKIPIDISEINALNPTVHIVKRSNAMTALVKLLLDVNLSQPGNLNFEHVKLLTTDGERAYGDPNTGNWWERLCLNYVAPGCVPLVLKFFTDGTICGKSKSRTPLMATIVNMRRSVQRSSFGKTYLAFAPQVSVHKVSKSRAADVRYRVKQEVYKLLLADIRPLGRPSFSLMIHGQVRKLQVFVENFILDGPEQRQATGIKSACNRCHCPKEKFGYDWDDLEELERSPRRADEARAVLAECFPLMSRTPRPRGAVQAVEEKLGPLNMRYGHNHTWDYPFASPGGIFAATATDRMHLVQGLIQNVMFVLDKVFEEESPNPLKPAAYKQSKQDLLDTRFALVAPYVTPEVYLPRFANGFYSKTLREAWHITAWLSLIPFLVGDDNAIIKSTVKRGIFLYNAILLMRIVHPMWAATSFTETEVLELEVNISRWRGHFRDNYTAFVKCTHEKFHKLLHVAEDIREHGVPGNHCTNTWEQGEVPSHPRSPGTLTPPPPSPPPARRSWQGQG
jgi:hypothetical protein